VPFKVHIRKDDSRLLAIASDPTEHYQSAQDELVHRAQNRLPIDLNSLQFLGNPNSQADERYLIFSELIEVNEIESLNQMSLKVTEEGTILKVYCESTSI